MVFGSFTGGSIPPIPATRCRLIQIYQFGVDRHGLKSRRPDNLSPMSQYIYMGGL